MFVPKKSNLAMETELEQEGNENAWRTADLRIRKTQVPVFKCCLILDVFVFDVVLFVIIYSLFPSYYRNGR